MSFRIRHRHCSFGSRRIIVYHIDLRVIRRFKHNLFRTGIATEHLCMHQHPATGRSIKPSEIQNRFRLASSEEIPLAIRPRFYPGMIIIRMRPTGSIYLPCRNPHRTQRSHSKCGFFSTTSIGCLHRCQRRTGTCITWTIDYLFMTPVIHFQNSILHGQMLHPILQFSIKHPTRVIQILIIHPDRQHKMPEQFIRNLIPPRHLDTRLPGQANILQIIISRIIRHIPYRHISIEKHQGFLLIYRQVRIRKNSKQVSMRKCLLFLFKVFGHLIPIILFFQKMNVVAGIQHNRQDKNG